MNAVFSKTKELKKILKNAFIFDRNTSVRKYKSLVKIVDGKEIWNDAFNKALKENNSVYIPKGNYFLNCSVILSSNKKITANKKAKICLIGGTKTVMFRNDSVVNGSNVFVGFDKPMTNNIFISGGMWGTEYNSRAQYGEIGAYDNQDSIHGVHALMLFNGVNNLSLSNMKFYNTATFAVQIGRCKNILIKNLIFTNAFADGVHINGVVENAVVKNIKGDTEDDLVALNAYDWENSTISNGYIKDLVVSNIVSTGGQCHCMRFLPGVLPKEKGGIDCYLKNIYISKITNVQTFKLYLQTPQYKDLPDGTAVGHIDGITFENLKIEKNIPSDNTPYLYNKDLNFGHFGIFEIGSNISSITLKNIKIKTKMNEDYPKTYHMITIGPKGFYVPNKNIEVFDPYVIAEVDKILYKNIKINNKKVQDLKKEIKEIKLKKSYKTEIPFGYGKFKNIKKLK